MITVSQSTSVVLITSLNSPNTVVLLSSISYPGHIVTIRDTTGSNIITTQPIIVSTMSGLKYYDGTSSFIINQPYGSITLSSKNSSTWQLLNSFGYLNSLPSNTYITTLTSGTAYLQQTSTISQYTSSLSVDILNVTKNLILLKEYSIGGNITFQNVFTALSSLSVVQNMYISSSFIVGGSALFTSPVFVSTNLILLNTVSSLNDCIIQNNLYASTASILNTKLASNISVQTLNVNSLNIAGYLQIIGNTSAGSLNISTANIDGSLTVFNSLSLANNLNTSSLNVLGNITTNQLNITKSTIITNDISVIGKSIFNSIISSFGTVNVASTLTTYSSLNIKGDLNVFLGLSTQGSISILGNMYNSSMTVLNGGISVFDSIYTTGSNSYLQNINIASNLQVNSNLYASSIVLQSGTKFSTQGYLQLTNSLYINTNLSTSGSLNVGNNIISISSFFIQDAVSSSRLITDGSVFVGSTLYVSSLLTTGTLYAPISSYMSTLVLSNTLTAWNSVVPIIITTSISSIGYGVYVNKIGTLQPHTQDLFVNSYAITTSSLQSQSTLYSGSLITSSIQINALSSFNMSSTSLFINQSNTIFNVTSLFRQNVSSLAMIASTITASSFIALYLSGDGSLLTNLTQLGSNFTIDTVNTNTINVNCNAFVEKTNTTNLLYINTTHIISTNKLYSTQNLFLAVGQDVSPFGNIKQSVDGLTWANQQYSPFLYSVYGVSGNNNLTTPYYVAVGADDSSLKTIQWSITGSNWNPITSGGFTYTHNSNFNFISYPFGYKVANDSNGHWIALGTDMGYTSTTLLYSSDNSINTWVKADGGFSIGVNPIFDLYADLLWDNTRFYAIGTNTLANYILKQSDNYGISWTNTVLPSQSSITAIGYGNYLGTQRTVAIAGYDLLYNAGGTWTKSAVSVSSFNSIKWNGSTWVGLFSDYIYTSADGNTWLPRYNTSSINITSAWNSNLSKWVVGSSNSFQPSTIWNSSDGISWNSATSFNGFSTGIVNIASGYAIAQSTNAVIVGGKSASNLGSFLPTLGILSTNNNFTTSVVNNVFRNQINALAYSSNEDYQWIGVGNGAIPSRTIGRSLNLSTWLGATTGGFISSGFGVAYLSTSTRNVWVAVGQASPLNTIQYSADGANWFGTNSSGLLDIAGYSVAVSSSYTYVVGESSNYNLLNTILYNNNGLLNNWTTATTGGFSVRGRAVCVGTGGKLISVGESAIKSSTIQYSSDGGVNWNSGLGGGFSIGGYGVANKAGTNEYVAVGEDLYSSSTIQRSYDGINWKAVGSIGNSFTGAGYSVLWNSVQGLWYAVGKDSNGVSEKTIKYSGNGETWTDVGTANGFNSEYSYGTAFNIISQSIPLIQNLPYLTACNLTIYDNPTSNNYQKNTIRLQSTFLTINESFYVNVSTYQVTINSNRPYSLSTSLTANRIYTSSLIFYNDILTNTNVSPFSTAVSTITAYNYKLYGGISLSTLSIGGLVGLPNNIIATNTPFSSIQINNGLFIRQSSIGIGISSPSASIAIEVSSITATSSFLTQYLQSRFINTIGSVSSLFKNDYLNIVNGGERTYGLQTNTIQIIRSSMTINNSLTLQISSQAVGLYTLNPLFDFDSRSLAVISTLNTSSLISRALFLRPQYC